MDFALPTPLRRSRHQDGTHRFFALILLASVALGLSISIVGAVMPEVANDLRLSDFQAGLSQSIFFLGHITGIGITGWCLPVWSPRQWLLASLTCTLLGVCCCATGHFPQLLLGRALSGMGLSASVIVISQLMVQRFAGKAGRLLSGFHAAVAMSASAALLLAPLLSAQLSSWRWTIGLVAMLCGLPLIMLGLVSLPHWRSTPANPQGTSVPCPRRRTELVGLVFIVGAYVSTEQIVTVFLPLALHDTLAPQHAASIAALFWGGVIAGRILGMFTGGIVPERWLLIGGGFTMSLALLLSAQVSSPWSIGALAMLAGAGGGPLVPLGFAQAARCSTTSAHGVLACQLACFAGGFLGPTAAGSVASLGGLSMSLLAIFALAPAVGSGFLLLRILAERIPCTRQAPGDYAAPLVAFFPRQAKHRNRV